MEPDKDRMDELLSQALKNYSVVEPRLGLETRVLVRLQVEQEKSPKWNWWFVAAATAAAAFGIAVFVMVQPARTPIVSNPVEAMNHSPATKDTAPPVKTPETGRVKTPSPRPPDARGSGHRRKVEQRRDAEEREEIPPKLDQFPSPRPLSEEERRLVRSVQEFHREATLMARAQTLLLEEETSERTQPAGSEETLQDPSKQ